jgi:hypothetical protein
LSSSAVVGLSTTSSTPAAAKPMIWPLESSASSSPVPRW